MKYAFQEFNKENMARAVGKDVPMSTKQAIEVCSLLKKKNVKEAERILEMAISLKKAIPLKRFNKGVGHKKGMAAGRYVVNTSQHILKLLKSAEANAAQKGLGELMIRHMSANRGARAYRYGRRSRIKAKRTNIEIVLEQKVGEKKK